MISLTILLCTSPHAALLFEPVHAIGQAAQAIRVTTSQLRKNQGNPGKLIFSWVAEEKMRTTQRIKGEPGNDVPDA